jgi:hypothetical protein
MSKKIINCVSSDIESFLYEYKNLDKKEILDSLSSILLSSGLESEIIIKILENFEPDSSNAILSIKINEGW